MRRVAWVVGVLIALAGTPPAAAQPYGHAGRWITDPAGRVLLISGVNMVFKQPPYTPQAAGFDADDAQFLSDNGIDAVRVGVIWKAVEPEPGRYDDGYLASIRRTVDLLAAHGVASLLDMHQDLYNERFQGEFAPDWAVLDDGLPAQPRLGFPGNMFAQPALWRAYENFWNDAPGPGGVGLIDRFAAAWAHVAGVFRGAPGVLGYDLLNEPMPGSSYPTCALPSGCVDDGKLTAMHRRVATAIRAVDPATTLFYEPFAMFNAGLPTGHGALGDPNAGFSFHDYCGPAALTDTPIGCDPFDERVFADAEDHAQRTGTALLLTEFGATDNVGIIDGIVDRAARHRVGWMYWAYCGCDDPTTQNRSQQGLVGDPHRPPTSDNVNQAKLRALSVPHPKAVAGTPIDYAFDRRTATFGLRYRAADLGVPTLVSTPRLHYPAGYRAEVSGARVISGPDAPVLELVASAAEVTVTVVPR